MSARNRRRGSGEWIGQVDWADLKYRALRMAVVIGWLGFVGTMLADAVGAAP